MRHFPQMPVRIGKIAAGAAPEGGLRRFHHPPARSLRAGDEAGHLLRRGDVAGEGEAGERDRRTVGEGGILGQAVARNRLSTTFPARKKATLGVPARRTSPRAS